MIDYALPKEMEGIGLKIGRAKTLLSTLNQQTQQFCAERSANVPIEPGFDATGLRYSFRATPIPIDPTFTILAGEIVHHLRSSLDHLAWALVLKNGNRPDQRTHFPVAKSERQLPPP